MSDNKRELNKKFAADIESTTEESVAISKKDATNSGSSKLINEFDAEKEFTNNKKTNFEEERKKLENQTLSDDNQGRKEVKQWAMVLTSTWMLFVLLILISTGNGNLVLSDTVLVTLLTTTTANVLGIILIVTKYFFKSKE